MAAMSKYATDPRAPGSRPSLSPIQMVAIRAMFRAEATAGMGDGRHEIDDPREHGWLAEPRGSESRNRDVPVNLAIVCQGYLREWRSVRRRGRRRTRHVVARC